MQHRRSCLVLGFSILVAACDPDAGSGDSSTSTTDTGESGGSGDDDGDGDGDTMSPLGECPPGTGTPQGFDQPLSCEVMPTIWCDVDCPMQDQSVLSCDRWIFPTLRSAPDGHPWILADSHTHGIAPTLVELGDVPMFTSMPGVNVSKVFDVDGDNTPHILHGADWGVPWLWHRSQDGTASVIACLTGESLWGPRGLEHGPAGLVGLVGWARGEFDSGLVLARRDLGGDWTVEDLSVPPDAVLELADDGTTIFVSSENVMVGDNEAQALGFVGEPLWGAPSLVPGSTSLLAAVRLTVLGLEVSTLDDAAVLPGTTPLPGEYPLPPLGCDPGQLTTCEGTCQKSAQGAVWVPFAARDNGDLVLAYLEVTIDIDGHFEGEICGDEGPGCSCDYIVDEDLSFGELLLARVDLPSFDFSEVVRVPLPFLGTNPRLYGSQAENGIVTLALQGADGPLHVGTFDPATVP